MNIHTKNKKRWTPELVAEIRSLRFEDRLSIQEIGNRYGVTRERIRQVLGNTGFGIIKTVPEKIKENNPYIDTLSVEEVMALYNCSRSYAYRYLRSPQHAKAFALLQRNNISYVKGDVGQCPPIWVSNKYWVKIRMENIIRAKNPTIHSPQHRFTLVDEKFPLLFDFYMFYSAPIDTCWIVPVQVITQKQTVQFCYPTTRPELSKFNQYTNRFDLLR